jgi:hypothetical protein
VVRNGKLAVAGTEWVEVRDVASGELLRRFDGWRVTAIDLDQRGDTILVFEGFKGRLSLLGVADGALRAEFTDTEDLLGGQAVALSADGFRAYVADLGVRSGD